METGQLVGRAFDFGGTTDFVIVDPGPKGIDTLVRSDRIPRMKGGAAAGFDVPEAGEVQIPILVTGTGSRTAASELRAAFRAMRRGEEELVLSGVLDEPVSIFGRPAGCTVDLSWPEDVPAICRFAALDPNLYGVEIDDALDSSSPTVVDAQGTVETDRVLITVVGNGGTPSITWVPDDLDMFGGVSLVDPLPIGDVLVINLRARTVTIEGDPAPESVDPASPWFWLEPGANGLTWSGCASVQVSYRPAFA